MTAEARIYDQGYRRYDGPRTGLVGAARALIIHSVRDALGLGRRARNKVFPFGIIIIAYLPAVAFIGLAVLLPAELRNEGMSYADYYGMVMFSLYLFAGFVAPELLCRDRRSGMLGVFLSSPLNRPTYLASKAVATTVLMLLVTLGPPLLMLISYTLAGAGPGGLGDWLEVFAQIVASSLVMGALFAAVALAVSSLTDRTGVATAINLALFPGSAMVSAILVEEAGLSVQLRLLSMMELSHELVYRIHGELGEWRPPSDHPTLTLWLAWLAWTGGSLVFIWVRYRKLLVRR